MLQPEFPEMYFPLFFLKKSTIYVDFPTVSFMMLKSQKNIYSFFVRNREIFDLSTAHVWFFLFSFNFLFADGS